MESGSFADLFNTVSRSSRVSGTLLKTRIAEAEPKEEAEPAPAVADAEAGPEEAEPAKDVAEAEAEPAVEAEPAADAKPEEAEPAKEEAEKKFAASVLENARIFIDPKPVNNATYELAKFLMEENPNSNIRIEAYNEHGQKIVMNNVGEIDPKKSMIIIYKNLKISIIEGLDNSRSMHVSYSSNGELKQSDMNKANKQLEEFINLCEKNVRNGDGQRYLELENSPKIGLPMKDVFTAGVRFKILESDAGKSSVVLDARLASKLHEIKSKSKEGDSESSSTDVTRRLGEYAKYAEATGQEETLPPVDERKLAFSDAELGLCLDWLRCSMQLEEANAKNVELEQQLQELRALNADLAKDLQRLQEVSAALEQDNDDLRRADAGSEERIAELNGTITTQKHYHEEQLADMRQKMANANEQIMKLQNELAESRQEKEEIMAEASRVLELQNAEIAKLLETIRQQAEIIQMLRAGLGGIGAMKAPELVEPSANAKGVLAELKSREKPT